jgi:hypothetical protein
MVSGHRTYLRVGGLWLLFAAAAHLVGHWLTFVDRRLLEPEMEASLDTLLSSPSGVDLWALFNQFSLAFGLFLLLAGTASTIASRRTVPIREARHWSGFAGTFWVLAFGLFLIQPLAPLLIISGTAAFLHVAAFTASRDGRDTLDPAWDGANHNSDPG